jgi:hypothetical protein
LPTFSVRQQEWGGKANLDGPSIPTALDENCDRSELINYLVGLAQAYRGHVITDRSIVKTASRASYVSRAQNDSEGEEKRYKRPGAILGVPRLAALQPAGLGDALEPEASGRGG